MVSFEGWVALLDVWELDGLFGNEMLTKNVAVIVVWEMLTYLSLVN
jgi:hypothetical protein